MTDRREWLLIGPSRKVNDTQDSLLVDGQSAQLRPGETVHAVPVARLAELEAELEAEGEALDAAWARIVELGAQLRGTTE